MLDSQEQVERLLKLLYRITRNNAWMPVTEIISSVIDSELHETDEELEKRLIEKYGTYLST